MANGLTLAFPAPTSAALGGFTQSFLRGLQLRRSLEEGEEIRQLRELRRKEVEQAQALEARRPQATASLARLGGEGRFSVGEIQDPQLAADIVTDPSLFRLARIQGLVGAEQLVRERRFTEALTAHGDEIRRIDAEFGDTVKTDPAKAVQDRAVQLSAAERRLAHAEPDEGRRAKRLERADLLAGQAAQFMADRQTAEAFGNESKGLFEAALRFKADPDDPQATDTLLESFQAVKTTPGLQQVQAMGVRLFQDAVQDLSAPSRPILLARRRVREEASRQGRVLTPEEEWAEVKRLDPGALDRYWTWLVDKGKKPPDPLQRLMGFDPKVPQTTIAFAQDMAKRMGHEPGTTGYQQAVIDVVDRLRKGKPDAEDIVSARTLFREKRARLNSIDLSLRSPNLPEGRLRRDLMDERRQVVGDLREAEAVLRKQAGVGPPKPPAAPALDPGQVRREVQRRLDEVAKKTYGRPFQGSGLTREQAQTVARAVEAQLTPEQREALQRMKRPTKPEPQGLPAEEDEEEE